MRDNPTPASVLLQAWSVFRLDKLQSVVNTTITELEQLAPRELLGRELSIQELEFLSAPVRQALAVCTDELRCESGICTCAQPIAHGVSSEPGWTAAYDEALGHYRRMAAQLLQASFGKTPARRR